MLKRGNEGAEVELLQLGLSRLGYLTRVDGKFGSTTERNLMSFQYDNSLKVDGVFGPLTKAVMDQKLSEKNNQNPTPVSTSETPWMDWLTRNSGQIEIPGDKANPFIIDLFRYTSIGGTKLATTDETAWCAALACAALEKNGYLSPHSSSAASFDLYGSESELKYGAIVTLRRSGGSGRHVTFYVGSDFNGGLKCIGGNQSNSLCQKTYARENLVSVRWPIKKTIT